MARDKKDKVIAAVLALFGGSFGIHRFYLGNTGSGIAHILFCWTMIPSIVSFVDCVGFLTMSQEAFDRKYNPHLYRRLDYGGNVNHFAGIPSNNVNVADEIHKLDLLFKRGVITFEEFERRKAKLLG